MQAASVLLPTDLPHISTVNAVLSPSYSSGSASIAIQVGSIPSPLSQSLSKTPETFPGVLQPPLSAVAAHRRRRNSKTTMPAIMKRSASTPNVRGQAAADAAALSLAADKRRNKLGYHRTSVACGKSFLFARLCLMTEGSATSVEWRTRRRSCRARD